MLFRSVVKEGEGEADLSDLEVGMKVEVKGYVENGENIAMLIKIEDEDNETELEVEGEITALTDDMITVNGTTFTLNSDTKVVKEGEGDADLSDLEIGMKVEVKGYVENGENIAKLIKIEKDDDGKNKLEVEGEITALTDDMITVSGTTFTLNSETKVIMELFGLVDLSDLKVGQFVVVKGEVKNGENIATMIKVKSDIESELEVEGEITAISDDMITVNGTTFSLTSETIVVKEGKGKIELGDLEVGMMVEVKGFCIRRREYSKADQTRK